ncbi:MAG: MCP four helix bundle domain-containing protein, partial [Thiobacillus sp.]|nr:MCP four helix bundle domain-containing protein [Thiobacillus sp.]
MLAFFRNCSLFKQLIVPMIVVGIIGASAIIASYFALQNSVRALGAMYTASGERLKTLQGIDKNIANVRALSLKHLASESAEDMNQVSADLDAVEHRIRTSLPIISKADMYGHRTAQKEAALLSKVLATYLAGIDDALQYSADFEKESAFDLLTRVETQHLASIQNAMQTLTQHTIEDIATSREDLIT